MKVVSLFAGVGGICQGFKNAGFDVVWANEIDQNACITYRLNHTKTTLIHDDINNIPINEIPDCDILTAGFPCQSFSIAGHRKGFSDGRGNLFFSILKILLEKKNKPKVIFLENVKNLVSHDKGNTFNIIKNNLSKLGYLLHFKVLNTHEYGNLPQNRERIFIVGFLDRKSFDKFKFPDKTKLTLSISSMLENTVDLKYYYDYNSCYYDDLKTTVTKNNTLYQIRRVYIRENKSNLCPTLTANMGTGGHNVPLIKDELGIRKLTPRECFNFQGFDKTFTLPKIANSHLYKQAGNSVSVPVVEKIAINIMKALEFEGIKNIEQN